MDSIESDWLGCKKDPIEIPNSNVGNIARSWQWRERGVDPPNYASNKTVLENVAEDILVQKPLKIRCCDLPGSPRSTFLMVFSPDGTKVASTHGNHNVYVSELASGKHVRVLQGHPRTPWCIAFHPSHTQLIGSGCLGGQVRVWDICSGGSEVWYVPNQTVISSIAFHPRVQLLVIATYNELYFWDWSKAAPFTKVSTNNLNEKVRYVAFDALGYKLITGISSWNTSVPTIPPLFEQTPPARSPQLFTFRHARRDEPDDSPSPNGQEYPIPGSTQEVIVNSYHSLVQRYDSLVRSYQRLFMFRHRMSVTPPPPATTDRGTDPMETDPSPETSTVTRTARSQPSSAQNAGDNPTPGTSRRQDESEADGSNSRLLNLDVLSFNYNSNPNNSLSQHFSTFGSRPSAFQPLNESTERTFRTVDQSERSSRLLPNPFSSTTGTTLPSRLSFGSPVIQRNTESSSSNTSRTSIFPSYRSDSLIDLSPRRRRLIPLRLQMSFTNTQGERNSSSTSNNERNSSATNESTSQSENPLSNNDGATNSSQSGSPRFSAFDLLTAPEDSQSINESLDLIRDILRDSGSRLVDLITRVSLSTLVGVGREENLPNNSDDSDLEDTQEPRRRNILSSSSDSDSDHSLEVNIFRTPNSTFREEDARNDERSSRMENSNATNSSDRPIHPADRIVIDLNNEPPGEGPSIELGGFIVPSDNPWFYMHHDCNSSGLNASASADDRRNITGNSSGDRRNNTDTSPGDRRNNVGTTSGDIRNNMGTSSGDIANSGGTGDKRNNVGKYTASADRRNNASTSSSDRKTSGDRGNTVGECFSRERNNTGSSSDDRNKAVNSSSDRNTASSVSSHRNTAGCSSSDKNNAGCSSAERHNVGDSSAEKSNSSSSPSDRNNTGNSPSDSRRTSESQPSYNSDFNPNRPSTSRDNAWSRSRGTPSEAVYRKVRAGVIALQMHTVQLTDMWLHGNTISLRELRIMWENLRRRILTIHRESNRQETPSYYTRSLLERCRTLNEMTEVSSRTSGRNPRRMEERSRNSGTRQNAANDSNEGTTSNETRSNDRDDRRSQTRSPLRRSPCVRSPPFRRRLLPTGALFRWRPEDDLRRRSRIAASNRLSQRYSNRSRREYARAIEIAATRHEIRMRAMQVLSVMFNSMMMCLEERGLSQVIINMLRLLKKALALTCLMLMTTRESARAGRDSSNQNQRVDSLNVIRIQNIDHTGPINVDGPEDLGNNSTSSDAKVDRSTQDTEDRTAMEQEISHYDQPSTSAGNSTSTYDPPLLSPSTSQKWSNRLAVQIAAANRNTSVTARNRRDLYMESRRLKALHRTNPTAHPLKKRTLPPVTTHRIPALRLPNTSFFNKYTLPRTQPSRSTESNTASTSESTTNDNAQQSSSRLPPDVIDEFEQRINLIRVAHMQAVRLRNAARNRFRRLQTIRLYTPSSVREMFTLQHPNNPENQPENRPSTQNESEQSSSNSRRGSFGTFDFRTRVIRDRLFPRSADEAQFHTVFNNVAMPLMQVNDLPTNEVEGPQPQRPPRIHEYLQPIILAQNAMVVDEDGNGDGELERGNNGPGGAGGAGDAGQRRINSIANLLDSGILTEGLPAPSHRIQAWDFTTGDTPDISNSTKNVVVAKCRIHNDASIDISKDGRILVALHPVPRLRTNNHWLGVYSLEWSRLGQCLHTAALEQSAVSVALSPTARHLAVGLGSRRFSSAPHAPHARNVFALLYRLEPTENSSRTGLTPIKALEQNWEHGFRSLNCLRWAPQPGQGFVYANNTGQLLIMS